MRLLDFIRFIGLSVAVLLLVVTQGALIAGLPREGDPETIVDHDHYLRLKILEVATLERTDRYQLLLLKVTRWYGKVDSKSLAVYQAHETQEFSIVFPARIGAPLKVGDILDYKLTQHIPLAK